MINQEGVCFIRYFFFYFNLLTLVAFKNFLSYFIAFNLLSIKRRKVLNMFYSGYRFKI